MGKPSDLSASKAADSVSLHSNVGESSRNNIHHDVLDTPEISIDDLPPNYSEVESLLPPAIRAPPLNSTEALMMEDGTVFNDSNYGAQYWIAKSLEYPDALESHIRKLAAIPPRPYIKLVGTHTETRRNDKDKNETTTVVDFDVSVELTPYLYYDAQYHKSWNQLRTVENFEKTKRGTIFRKRAPGTHQNIEVGGNPKPTLTEWCHRYAASHAGLKVFALHRTMIGFNEERVKSQLRTLVNNTNYRGHLKVELVMKNSLVECYNEARTNHWRLTTWIQTVFMVTLLFIFSWPYLWLRTKRWEVAISEWPFSRLTEAGAKEYVSISEDQWYNLWARAISKAVMEKRQKVLDQADLRRSQEPEPSLDTGNYAVNGALGLFRAGVSAMNEVNRQLGWGGDC
ncbi:uncharacterized protein GGS22DRAFT_35320 [Annulohypoxylon maeteangense]|uniref:uncharacterized protein n=1 Tax=Annulohypoxylon maeteangense TaxID=1927788 RepID=UPI0020074CFE|nr:uncharacterized protein GGS22DRAFT_35320 [Annulohypoxylon maeteangense]KAI0883061.1 hypothetical protein GGS22DRAFT_35320 [Annulohypoxylon maeteangense]